jgi:malonyl-CoA O-methyltransferase
MLNWLRKKNITVLSPYEGYERWARTYSTESNPIKDFSNKIVEQFLPDMNGKSVLDAGCGTGYFCSMAQRRGAATIVGTDFSAAMLEQARKNCPSVEFQCAEIDKLSFAADSFDLIVCALVLAHLENITSVITTFSSFLKKDGELILTDFHPVLTAGNSKRTFKDSETGNTFEITHFLHPLEEIQKLINDSGFEILTLEEPQWNNVPVIYAIKARKL